MRKTKGRRKTRKGAREGKKVLHVVSKNLLGRITSGGHIRSGNRSRNKYRGARVALYVV